MLETPVALLVFNRPEPTRRVLEAVARARPARLFVVADGPRPDRPDDAALCAATRAMFEHLDWPCEVTTDFAASNLGCRRRLSGGISWVFEQVPEAIFLEDDCLPDASFFPYCEELLARYRDDPRIFIISGDNFLFGRHAVAHSYYATRFLHIWGWAGWRRAWRHYDVDMRAWPGLRDTPWLEQTLDIPGAARHFRRRFDATHAGRLNTWDYQWALSMWRQDGLAIAPARNLVQNIGVGAQATNMAAATPEALAPLEQLDFPLRHPSRLERDLVADRVEAAQLGLTAPRRGLLDRWKSSLRKRLSRWR
jgi:hypothetical protein